MALTDTTEVPNALYNRYRPRRLSDLVGQEHVATPLRRAFEKGRIHHAYLLSGPRGCGKTSTARILAAGLVCDNGPTADPCNTCDQCTAVIKGNHIDVIEMDAASNGGVDDARELRERAHFAPAIARFKVIVVDEAHMVTPAGFNALLKLIEEPPPHVRFIFATTNPEKVLGTIRSRTYHYAFRLVPAPALAAHLETVISKEGATLDDGVLPLVLRAGGGSMRDSLAVLGQLLDGSDNGHVHLNEAAALLGATADTILDNTIEALAARDTAAVLTTIGTAIDSGVDPRRLTEDLLDRLRDLLLLSTTGQLPPLAEVAGPQRQAAWNTAVARLGTRGLTIACETLQKAAATMHTGQPRITLEVAAARTLLALADNVDVHTAIRTLSQQISALPHGAVPQLPPVSGAPTAPPTPAPVPAPATAQPAASTPSAPATVEVAPSASPVKAETAPAHTTEPSTVSAPAYAAPLAADNDGAVTPGVPARPDPEPDYAPEPPATAPEDSPAPSSQTTPTQSPLSAIATVIEDIPNPNAPTPAPTAAPTAAPPAPSPVPAPSPEPVPTNTDWNNPTSTDTGWDPEPTQPAAPPASADGDAWPRLLEAVKNRRRVTWMMLTNQATPVSIANGRIILTITPAATNAFHDGGHPAVITDAAHETFGGTWTVETQAPA